MNQVNSGRACRERNVCERIAGGRIVGVRNVSVNARKSQPKKHEASEGREYRQEDKLCNVPEEECCFRHLSFRKSLRDVAKHALYSVWRE